MNADKCRSEKSTTQKNVPRRKTYHGDTETRRTAEEGIGEGSAQEDQALGAKNLIA
jgi:hypothetical protein